MLSRVRLVWLDIINDVEITILIRLDLTRPHVGISSLDFKVEDAVLEMRGYFVGVVVKYYIMPMLTGIEDLCLCWSLFLHSRCNQSNAEGDVKIKEGHHIFDWEVKITFGS